MLKSIHKALGTTGYDCLAVGCYTSATSSVLSLNGYITPAVVLSVVALACLIPPAVAILRAVHNSKEMVK